MPENFLRWWRRRSNLNAEELRSEGKAMKASNYTVSEEQVNRQYHLAPKTFRPGQVLEKLQGCGIPIVPITYVPGDGEETGVLKLGWNPKKFSRQQRPVE